ncbi:phosphoesterase PA-phosphatase [Rhizobium sp. Root274]|uniref:vanadium-dependent haloperoxidase n=1 Tax=unclassified Rhizobium TaxID=2613769 RepID=UPI0007162996|nr:MULTISPECIES: vanadium-dependent haloperoxidase [unclassified Rhizobium]KQW32059.1 phosphoesterase PA-phosphatase [Rhizobium sp. Root1240]KRD33595.1 phosphoesterase PA-phosphatase [Rhizobium sp. Root274]
MNAGLQRFGALIFFILSICLAAPVSAAPVGADKVIRDWYHLMLELVRHTPTYSPPVASRAFAYLGVTGYEALASGDTTMISLAGQLNGLTPVPARIAGESYDEAVVVNAALGSAARVLFSNTGPTGQRALKRFSEKMASNLDEGLSPELVARSTAYGESVTAHILAWSEGDGGAKIENMGFPLEFALTKGPSHWVPTSQINQQQMPLLPKWGENRPFAMPEGGTCGLPAPPAYSEEKGSVFYQEALEVYDTVKNLTPEQRAIARFWSDDPMLSPTPPGHWMAIALKQLDERKASAADHADLLARLGVTLADAFIGCWHTKFEYDLLRPVTYIKRVIDPKWEPILITPPFPEYPSGHSTQSGAAATVLTAFFGENYAFTDSTHEKDSLPNRPFKSFWAAAEEAGISRLYGGIHFRSAVDRGLEQGRCIGARAVALKTRS